MSKRAQMVALLVICLVGLVRGGWWVAVTEVVSPIDEQAHVDYVEHVARHGTPPIVGRSLVSNDVLELAKRSATSPWRASPLAADHNSANWGAFAQSYEGVQGPAYYALLAGPYRLARGHGQVTTLFILRALTLLLALVCVPLLWLLGRELFPERAEVGLAAGALVVMLPGFNANLATVTNDSLVLPLATAALWLVARTWRRGYEARSALAVGALVALAVLTKTTALVLLPLVAIGALGPLWTRGAVARRYFTWGAQCGATAALIFSPWLVWNQHTYHSLSAAGAVDKITGPLQPAIPLSAHGVVTHLKSAGQGFWTNQLAFTRIGHAAIYWTAVVAVAILGGLVVSVRRHHTRDALAIGWVASAVPFAFVSMVLIIVGVFGGSSSVVGRHLYAGLPALMLAVAASLFVGLDRRAAFVVLALMIAGGVAFERADTNRYVRGTYTRGIFLGLSPVVGQTRGDQAVAGPLSIFLKTHCGIGGVSVEFASAPTEVVLRGERGDPVAVTATVTRPDAGRGTFAFFTVPAPTRRLHIEIPAGAQISATRAGAAGTALSPVASAYCPRPHQFERRFDALFHPEHPAWSLATATRWPDVWNGLSGIGVFVAVAYMWRGNRWKAKPTR